MLRLHVNNVEKAKMTKKKNSKASKTRPNSNQNQRGVGENVHSLCSPAFVEAVDELTREPTIRGFLRALRTAGNPVEVASLLEAVPALIDALTIMRPSNLKAAQNADVWGQVWQLAAMFTLIEPLEAAAFDASGGAGAATTLNPVEATAAPLSPAANKFHDAVMSAVNKIVDNTAARKTAAQSKGLRSNYAHVVDWSDACSPLRPALGFDPVASLDEELTELIAARVVDFDDVRDRPPTEKPLQLNLDHRAQIAVLWDAACLRLLLSEPRENYWAMPDAYAEDDGKDFSVPMRLFLPAALSGLGCLLLTGSSRLAATLASENQLRHTGPRGASRAPAEDGTVGGLAETESREGVHLFEQMILNNSMGAADASTRRSCAEPLRSVQEWAKMAGQYSPSISAISPATSAQPADVLRQALLHAPLLPPMLVEALIRPAFALNNWVEFDDEYDSHCEMILGFERALLAGDREQLLGPHGYVDLNAVSESEGTYLLALLGMSRRLSLASTSFIASTIDCRSGIPTFWLNLPPNDGDDQITRMFLRYQKQLVEAERRYGSRAVVDEDALRTAFSLRALFNAPGEVSVRWAIEQVLRDDPFDDEPQPEWRRAQNFGRLTSLLFERGLGSLAAAFFCFFTVTQSQILARKAMRSPPGMEGQENLDLIFVDDWKLYMANANRLLTGQWADRVKRSVAFSSSLFAAEVFATRLAFESRQLLALIPVERSRWDGGEEALATILRLPMQEREFQSIESRLKEAIGSEYHELPHWIREALKFAERQFETVAADRGVVSLHVSNPWVMEYAKIVEQLLREGLGVIWRNATLKPEAEWLYAKNTSSRRFPQRFEVGAALAVLRAARLRGSSALAKSLESAGVDFAALSGQLGDDIQTVVTVVRNKEAHTEAPAGEGEAQRLRVWVLQNVSRVYAAVGSPGREVRGGPHDQA